MPRLAAALILTGVALAALRRRPLVGHWSDCAVHSEPAFPAGACDCGDFPLSRTVH